MVLEREEKLEGNRRAKEASKTNNLILFGKEQRVIPGNSWEREFSYPCTYAREPHGEIAPLGY
jgi:hypothetical protein